MSANASFIEGARIQSDPPCTLCGATGLCKVFCRCCASDVCAIFMPRGESCCMLCNEAFPVFLGPAAPPKLDVLPELNLHWSHNTLTCKLAQVSMEKQSEKETSSVWEQADQPIGTYQPPPSLEDQPRPSLENGLASTNTVTMMINNLPSRCGKENLRLAIDSFGFAGTYVSLRLPMAKHTNGKCTRVANMPYAFVEFESAHDAARFAGAFEGYKFTWSGSSKRCDVRCAGWQDSDNMRQALQQ